RALSKGASPHKTRIRLTDSRSFCTRVMPPARSWVLAGTTSRAHSSPSVSTATNRLRPLIFFPRVEAARAALLGRLHRRAVEDGRGRLGLLAGLAPDLVAQGVVDPVPGAVPLPDPEVVEHDAVRRQVVGQGAPDAAVAGLVQDGVDDLAPGIPGR